MQSEWVALCGEPYGNRKCIKKKGHQDMHNAGAGISWAKFDVYDCLMALVATLPGDVPAPKSWIFSHGLIDCHTP